MLSTKRFYNINYNNKIELLIKLRLVFSHLWNQKFRHKFKVQRDIEPTLLL